ncbi:reverse transcriptase domain-containing protein [Tanacetum coccineum]
MDDPNITREEYLRLEEEKAQKRRKVFNRETAKYGKIWYDKDVLDLRSVETEFPAIVFNDSLTSNETPSCEPTVSSPNDEIDFRISFDESDDEDYTDLAESKVIDNVDGESTIWKSGSVGVLKLQDGDKPPKNNKGTSISGGGDIDQYDQLLLHSNDTSGVPLINFKLEGTDNYKVWKVAITIAIHSKNKLGFINGKIKRPEEEGFLQEQ